MKEKMKQFANNRISPALYQRCLYRTIISLLILGFLMFIGLPYYQNAKSKAHSLQGNSSPGAVPDEQGLTLYSKHAHEEDNVLHLLSAKPETGGFVYYEENGKMICRQASSEESRWMNERGDKSLLHVISDDEQIRPQAEGGLKIILRATPQLESNPAAKAAFIKAAAKWEALIQTPITLVIDVDYGPTRFGEPYPAGVLGSTDEQSIGGSSIYPSLRTKLIENTTSSGETSLYNGLPNGTIPTDKGNTAAVVSSSAIFRALGYLNPIADPVGERANLGDPPSIGFNTVRPFDFDPDNGVDPGKYDFVGVAVHEIGHALGFVSEVGFKELSSQYPVQVSIWDLFRFRPGVTPASFATSQRILSSGGSQVFFAGGSPLSLSTGRPDGSGGDGNQASHWKDDQGIGIMDPTADIGTPLMITQNDINAIDIFGYTLRTPTLPPPGSGELEELKIDDGGTEGGAIENNFMVVNRVTPNAYPATLRRIRVYIAQASGFPSPVGQTIRLLAFTTASGITTPPGNPNFVVSQNVTIPSADGFVDFEVSGPTVNSGDIWIGFQSPNPANGVAAWADTTGVAQFRSYFSRDNGTSFRSFLFSSSGGGVNANVMVRALVSKPGGTTTDLVDLGSGGTASGSISSSSQSGLCRIGATQYSFQVPNDRARITITANSTQAVLLLVRFGQRVTIENGQFVSDFRSPSAGTSVSFIIGQGSSPPLRQGTYYLAVSNCSTAGQANFNLNVQVDSSSGGNNLPIITSLSANLTGNELLLRGTATDLDGDITQAQITLIDNTGLEIDRTAPGNVSFGTTANVNISITVTGLASSGTLAAVKAGLILFDSRGNRSTTAIADFSQADPGGATISKALYNVDTLTLKGFNFASPTDVEINGVIVSPPLRAKVKGNGAKINIPASPGELGLRSGANRIRLRIFGLRSNLFVLRL
jgi:hypothetical protein